ncbi:unnamed protein product [Heterobilharzia americana]|nr:unnamed protein product [Heterobilharzia americana]
MYSLVSLFMVFGYVACDKVLELTKDNFHSELKSRPVTLVKFYAPWCGHCKNLAPAFSSAADIISEKTDDVTLAKLDCTAHETICSEFKVSGYPTLKIFRNGVLDTEYNGPRTAAGIADYMVSRAGPPSKEISSVADVENVLSDSKPTVVAFIKSASSPWTETFLKLATSMVDDALFSHSHNNIFESSGDYEIRLYLPKRLRTKLEDDYTMFQGEMTTSNLKSWTGTDSNLVVIYNNQSIDTYPSGVKYLRNRILKTLKDQSGKFKDLKFAYSFTGDFSYELTEFGLEGSESPVVRIRSSDNKKYKLDKFSLEAFLEFLNKFQDDDSSAVKKLVALNFDEIVNDEKKDVMVVFHAPWCGHCKSLMPKYEEAAKKLKDEPNLILAAMDATANDVHPPYEVTGFPTIYFVPRAKKSSPMPYQGGRTTEDIIKFLAREATEELSSYDRSGNEKKKEL